MKRNARRGKNAAKDRIVFRMGKRVYIRPVLEEDLPKLVVWINDPDVTRFLKIAWPITPIDEKKWLERLAEKKGTDAVFAIVLADTDEIIGVTGLHRIDFRDGLAVTGSFIGRKDLWSNGYGTESKMLVLDYAFNTLGLRKICSYVYDFNGRSKRCLEKCGYHVEGRRKRHLFRDGRYVDEFLLAVFREDFIPLWERYKKDHLGASKTSAGSKKR